jgi:hypothetical protein
VGASGGNGGFLLASQAAAAADMSCMHDAAEGREDAAGL